MNNTLHTRVHPYSPLSGLGEGAHQFAALEGIPADLAIENASAMLNAGVSALRYALQDQSSTPQTASLWSAFYALEAGIAIVNALTFAIEEGTS